jgi:hypothetical protein
VLGFEVIAQGRLGDILTASAAAKTLTIHRARGARAENLRETIVRSIALREKVNEKVKKDGEVDFRSCDLSPRNLARCYA